MQSFSVCQLFVLAVLAVWPVSGIHADIVPLSPAAAERLLDRGAEVTSEFQQLVERVGADRSENLNALADTGSPDWRLYYRDQQMLFAVPTRRNLTAAEKTAGEREAAKLAGVMLQQRFSQLLRLGTNVSLAPESVRVVFIEPAAHAPAGSGWGRGGFGGCGQNGGFAGVPIPFAPAGFWPGSGGGFQGGCGCH